MKAPKEVPSPKTPDAGYEWVYRGMGWVNTAYECDYCTYRDYAGFNYYSAGNSKPAGYGDAHYFELVKSKNTLEAKIEYAKELVGKKVYFTSQTTEITGKYYVDSWHVTNTKPSNLGEESLVDKELKANGVCVYVLLSSGVHVPVNSERLELDKTPEYKEVKLNSSYTAKVYKDKIEVGCQTFPVSILKELTKALKEVSSN